MIATVTLLGFLKCLGYVILGIVALGVVAGLMLLWSEKIWPIISPKIPEGVKMWSALIFFGAVVLLMLFMVFGMIPWMMCTEYGGCA